MMRQGRRFLQLSPAWQALVRLFQRVNFGEIKDVMVRNADPILDHAPVVVFDVRLDREEGPRPELGLIDFDLPAEVCRLVSLLDELNNGTIQSLEVRAGIPQRLVFKSRSWLV